MEIVMEANTGSKTAWAELEHFVLQRAKQRQSGEEPPEFADFEDIVRDEGEYRENSCDDSSAGNKL